MDSIVKNMADNDQLKQLRRLLREEIQSGLGPIRRDFLGVKVRLASIEKRSMAIEKRLGALESLYHTLEGKVERGFKSLKKEIRELFDFLDRDYANLQTQVKRIKEHLELPARN